VILFIFHAVKLYQFLMPVTIEIEIRLEFNQSEERDPISSLVKYAL